MALLDGTIGDKTSGERRVIFARLINDVFLPQRRGLLSFRDHTWQSAYVDDDGYFAELIASVVVGCPGVTRRGVTRTSGDLADETEVKKGYRLDPNIDFVLSGTVVRGGRGIVLGAVPAELALLDIRRQLNANACSVQRLVRAADGHYYGAELGRTMSKRALPHGEADVSELLLTRGALPSLEEASQVEFCIRQERGHINFGNKSRVQLDAILASRPVLVFYQHDPRGRMQVAVVRVGLDSGSRTALLDRIYAAQPDRRCQIQPYLMLDNERTSLASSEMHSVAHALQGRLLALGVEERDGFRVQYWDGDGQGVPVTEAESLLTSVAPIEECPPFEHERLFLSLGDVSEREAAAEHFFEVCMDRYYRALEPYCRLTRTTRNMSFGNLSQHLVSLVSGVRGTRSGARGADLVELDGAPSEIKLATGQRGGDAMQTEDSPRLTLGWGAEKMLSWKRLFAVRIVDEGSGLRVLVQAPNESTMEEFRGQVDTYFSGRVNNGSGGLQYHAQDVFPHDSYGPRERRLHFVRVGDFKAGSRATFPSAVPSW